MRSHLSSASFQDCYFENNSGGLGAGAIWSSDDQGMEIYDCTFVRNHADAGGPFLVAGAVSFEGGTGTIANSLFLGNEAAVGAGAVAVLFDASVTMIGCTIVGNIGFAAVYVSLNCEADIQNTIIAFNSGPAVDCWDAGATLTCCDLFGNEGDWVVCVADQVNVNGNIHLDPLFCDIDRDWDSAPTLHVHRRAARVADRSELSASPVAPHPSLRQVGDRSKQCSTVDENLDFRVRF